MNSITINTETYVSAAAGLWIAERIGQSIDKRLCNASKSVDAKVRRLAVEIFTEVGHGILDEVISCLKNPHSEEEERALETKCDYIASLAVSIERPKSVTRKSIPKDPPSKSIPVEDLPSFDSSTKRTSLKREHWTGIVNRIWDQKFIAEMEGPDGATGERMFLRRNHLDIWNRIKVGTRFNWNVKRRATGQVRESEIILYEDNKYIGDVYDDRQESN